MPISPTNQNPALLSDALQHEIDAGRLTVPAIADAFGCGKSTAYEMVAGAHDDRVLRDNRAIRVLPVESSRAIVATFLHRTRWTALLLPEFVDTDLNGDGRTDARDMLRAVARVGSEYHQTLEGCVDAGAGMLGSDCAAKLSRELDELEAAVQVAKAILPKITLRRQ